MPQARLPDVNTAFITYRSEVIRSLKSYDYLSCLGALKCVNAMLPQEYRVQLNDDVYKEKAKVNFTYTCISCKKTTSGDSVKSFSYQLSAIDTLITNQKSIKVWECVSCESLNNLADTEITKDVLSQPNYLHVVPLPPTRRNGLMGRSEFRIKFSAWAWNMITELEERMAKFRDDNWRKGEEE